MTVKYKFALDQGTLVDVVNLTRETIPKGKFYNCVVCNEILIPRLGKKNQKHFAHKPDVVCCNESYLHAVAKTLLYETYLHCLKKGKSFLLELHFNFQCNSIPNCDSQCSFDETQSYDLTQKFTNIELEPEFNGFRPDILISDRKSSKFIMLEIKVANACSSEKIASGHPIVELFVNCENDLIFLQKAHIPYKSDKVKRYNFNTKTIEKNCSNPYYCSTLKCMEVKIDNQEVRYYRKEVGGVLRYIKQNNLDAKITIISEKDFKKARDNQLREKYGLSSYAEIQSGKSNSSYGSRRTCSSCIHHDLAGSRSFCRKNNKFVSIFFGNQCDVYEPGPTFDF